MDAAAQTWMTATSRRKPKSTVQWLLGPAAGSDGVGDRWIDQAAAALGGHTSTGPTHGLLPQFNLLAGDGFDPTHIDPRIVDFYEHTSCWGIDLWSEWSPLAWPFGRAITALWSHRLQQLSLPMRPLDVTFGMDSKVVHIHDQNDAVAASAWIRTMRKTGETTYSGQYGVVTRPGSNQPSVRVVFPLPQGCLPVLLRPSAAPDGSLHLDSPIGPLGADGAYLVLEQDDDTVKVRRIPISEHFHLYVDEDGDVRADHSLRLFNIPAVKLHYRMRRSTESDEG